MSRHGVDKHQQPPAWSPTNVMQAVIAGLSSVLWELLHNKMTLPGVLWC
jgi:hypothetical protein